jgi:L-gulonolactone oxidase
MHHSPHARCADLFHAALVSFGALGIITGMVVQCVRAFDLHAIETPSTLPTVLRDLKARIGSAPFYRFWWFPHSDGVMEWRGFEVAPNTRRPPALHPLQAAYWVRLVRQAWEWVLFMGVGFHALQFALWLSIYLPLLVPAINRVWYWALFSWRKEVTDRSDRVFNFNCLFKQ